MLLLQYMFRMKLPSMHLQNAWTKRTVSVHSDMATDVQDAARNAAAYLLALFNVVKSKSGFGGFRSKEHMIDPVDDALACQTITTISTDVLRETNREISWNPSNLLVIGYTNKKI